MYVKIPYEALMKMPVMDRKYYMHKYNEYMEARNAAMQEGSSSSSSSNIGMFTNLSQGMSGDDAIDF